MADTTNSTGAPIEALLRERARYNEWLAKLDGASSGVPHAVRDKVRSDYDTRLRRVMEELKSHAATIRDELARHRSAQADLESRRSAAEEALAEASVRHTVGEYSDDEWRRLSEETSQALGLVQADLAKVRAEITRLVEVQGLIADRPQAPSGPASAPASAATAPHPAPMLVTAPSAPLATPSADAAATAAPPIDMLPDPTPDVSAASGSASAVEPVVPLAVPPVPPTPTSAPRFVPKPSPEPARSRTGGGGAPVDELAFLKSVSADAGVAGSANPPGRRSGETHRPEAPAEPAAPAAAGKHQAKTLKCGECGTLNRATEWYCERCGAELAAL
ncbi:MAG: zinc finger Ran-binding domain-containing protein [Gemmatimonadales bacterium]